MGRKLAYFEAYPDQFSRAMLVCQYILTNIRRRRSLTSAVLVARTNSLRNHLRRRQDLNYHHSPTNHRRQNSRLDPLRRNFTRHSRRSNLPILHHLPMQSRRPFLAPTLPDRIMR